MLVFGQCAVAGLHTLQHKEGKKDKGGIMPFVNDQCTKFIFALLLCWFYLIRTHAFSVFSEVSCGGAAVRRNNTQMSKSQKRQLFEQRRRPVDDLVFFFFILSRLLFSLLYLFCYFIFTCSSPYPLSQGGAMHGQ